MCHIFSIFPSPFPSSSLLLSCRASFTTNRSSQPLSTSNHYTPPPYPCLCPSLHQHQRLPRHRTLVYLHLHHYLLRASRAVDLGCHREQVITYLEHTSHFVSENILIESWHIGRRLAYHSRLNDLIHIVLSCNPYYHICHITKVFITHSVWHKHTRSYALSLLRSQPSL